ncbi:MAG TPA: VOC family protein [Alphaproteobacteria bacterium]|nr:VOC family protein [Alphaproteobacteria bacterium]
MHFNPYLAFKGNCEEAFKFYAEVLGGEILAMLKHRDTPMKDKTPPGMEEFVMHARMNVDGKLLMGGDAPDNWYKKPEGFNVHVGVDTPEEAERIFTALSEGGTVSMPLQETFWAHKFGTCVDRFGTPWMVNCEKPM